uniref:Copine C-terminal domain-containing protein n=1 Tax=Setaria digitata TaxID=48799 RepID=A0A915Q2X7_9BILA
MNMTRIRQIIALRKALKAGPLLPPVSRSREKSFGDGLYNKAIPRDILQIDLHISELKIDLFAFDDIVCLISINENGSEGPWKLVSLMFDKNGYREPNKLYTLWSTAQKEGSYHFSVTTTEVISKADVIFIPNAFSVDYAFKRDQYLKIEICDYSEEEVIIIGIATFFVTEIVTGTPKLSKPLFHRKNGKLIAALTISYTAQPREELILLQFCGKNLPKKGFENTQLRVGPERNKKVGAIIEVIKCNEIIMYSFLDYITSGYCLSLAVAVDFSALNLDSANATFASDVECVIRSICEPFRRHNLQNLDTDPNCQGIDGLIDAFWKANAQVQPSTTAHFAHIIYHLSKLANNVRRRESHLQQPYFVLVIISKGKISDIRETVQATIFASKAPLSIVFIATEDDCGEMERLGLSSGRISYQNRRAERDMLQFVSLTKFRSKLTKDANFGELLAERALRRVPWQMINWLMRNGHTPQDFKHFDCSSEQGSSGTSGLGLAKRQQRIREIQFLSCDQSIDDLDETECASTSDFYNVKEDHSCTGILRIFQKRQPHLRSVLPPEMFEYGFGIGHDG